MIKKEGNILDKLSIIDYCVKIKDFIYEIPVIVLEFCEGGTLKDIITEEKISYQDRIEIIHQILIGIEQCHKKNSSWRNKTRKYIIKI